MGAWGKPRLLQSSTRNGRVTTAFGQRPQLGKLVLFLRPQIPGVCVPLRQGALGGLCSLKERGCTKPVLYVTSVGWISFHFKSETSPGRRAFNRGETERVYTAARTRARLFPRVAALFLRVAARWPTRRLCHFLLNPHPLRECQGLWGCRCHLRHRDKPSFVPRNPRRRWCLLSAPPPWFPAQRVGPASTAESAQAQRGG